MELLRFLLYPLALLYGLAVWVRNFLFDIKILRSTSFPIPVISVGNLVAGGSGKTPTVEYIIRLLAGTHCIATLSRGYKRKTHGFILASEADTVETIGDEPLQYHLKYPEVSVALHESRRQGIRELLQRKPEVETVILDDAFQHRYVFPDLSILVTDYHKIYSKDHLLPVGRLREPKNGSRRADIIVVTKTPRIFSPMVRRQILEDLKAEGHQLVCFSFISYDEWLPVFPGSSASQLVVPKVNTILLITGIAFPAPIVEYLRPQCSELSTLEFPDHHEFSEKDLSLIRDKYLALPTRRKLIITTEKDAMRLRSSRAESLLSEFPFYYLPIRFQFHAQDKIAFEDAIRAVVKQKNRVSIPKAGK